MPFLRALDVVICNHDVRYNKEIRHVPERWKDHCLAKNYTESDLVTRFQVRFKHSLF